MSATARPQEVLSLADRLAHAARRASFDAFEVRAEAMQNRQHQLNPRNDTQVGYSGNTGIGLRAWVGGCSAYGAILDLEYADIQGVVERVSRLAHAGAKRGSRSFTPVLSNLGSRTWEPSIRGDPFERPLGDVDEILLAARDAALEVAPEARVVTSYSCTERIVRTMSSAGGTSDVRHFHAGLYAHALCRENGRTGDYTEVKSGLFGLDDMRAERLAERAGAEAATYALEGTRAETVAAGRSRVLVDSHLSGLLAHESFGHLTEYDLVASGWSVLQGRVGEALADARMSIVDAPTPPQGRIGVHVPIDDEGTRGEPLRILDRGTLRAYMHQRDSATAQEETPTGNGRALDVRFPPIVRMRNTYVEPGDLSFEEAIEALGDGLYLCGGRGGSPHSDGSFMFTSQRGYRVEKGQIVAPIKGPSLVGNILNFLPNVEGMTKDFGMFSNTFGGCGKWAQSYLHVGFGGPHIIASNVLIGGHASAETVEASA